MGGKFQRLRAKLKNIKTWHLVLVLLLLIFTTATFYRIDNLKVQDLKQQLTTADNEADDVKITSLLNDIKSYATSHTIFTATEKNGTTSLVLGTGPIYLEASYNRAAETAIQEAQERAASTTNPNGNIYAAAMSVCQPLAQKNGWKWNSQPYIDCYQTELAKYPSYDLENFITANVPSTDLYRYDFASPIWSPTFSGFFALLAIILAIIIIIRIIIWVIVKIALKVLKNT